jgi:aquaporin Z
MPWNLVNIPLIRRNFSGVDCDLHNVSSAILPATEPAHAATLRWTEYLLEAVNLGVFMLSASIFGVLLEHPSSFVHQSLDSGFLRRALMGAAMGLTAIVIIRSPLGQRSGAHMNPAVTLAYYMLGKIRGIDAAFYALFQFIGGLGGILLARLLIGMPLADSPIHFVATLPGDFGNLTAFTAELGISFLLMFTVLVVSNARRTYGATPFVAGALVALFITFEAPLSGMSMNPARTLGSAIAAWDFRGLWIYFSAPPLGMLSAAALYRQWRGQRRVYCAKVGPHGPARCIFLCRFEALTND